MALTQINSPQIMMNTSIVYNNEALDLALVQCLKLFAQHGRKIRSQKLSSEQALLDKAKAKQGPDSSSDQETSQQ